MLPALGFAAVWFRFQLTDARIAPGRQWDACLILSVIGLFIAAGWGVFSETVKLLGDIERLHNPLRLVCWLC
jgi:hypothetical protein